MKRLAAGMLACAVVAGGCSLRRDDGARPQASATPLTLPTFNEATTPTGAAGAVRPANASQHVALASAAEAPSSFQLAAYEPWGLNSAGALAADLQNPAELPPPASEGLPLPPPDPAPLTLDDVVTTVYASYPALDAATRERQIAAGLQLAAQGNFDLNLVGETLTEPLGYYENYRYGLGAKQYHWNGGQTFAGYRLGRGNFEPWYLERETNKGGEFKAGFAMPFLRNRDIDKRRAAVFKSQIDRSAAEPLVQLEVVESVRAASMAYWDWVAAGQRVRVARRLLELATTRQDGLVRRAALGDVAEIELVDNRRLIVSRQAKLIDAERKLQQSAIKLSLFLRDLSGAPLLAQADQLPYAMPDATAIDAAQEAQHIAQALALRPELRLLDLQRQRLDVDVRQAANMLLPNLDGVFSASQDVGEATSPKRDKSPLELEAGVLLEVPLERRAAQGKLQAAQAKMAQVAAKRRLTEQKIIIDVQTAGAGLVADFAELAQARQSVELAEQMEEAERKRFDRGDSNILVVNLREQATADAQMLVVDAAADYFMSQALLHAAIAAELAGRSVPSPASSP